MELVLQGVVLCILAEIWCRSIFKTVKELLMQNLECAPYIMVSEQENSVQQSSFVW